MTKSRKIVVKLYFYFSFNIFCYFKDSLSDSYLNTSECVQTTNNSNYVQTTVITPRVFQIPVIDSRKEQRIQNYNDIDHQRTKALRDITEQRTQQRLFH